MSASAPCPRCGGPRDVGESYGPEEVCWGCWAVEKGGDRTMPRPEVPTLVVRASEVRSASIRWAWTGWSPIGYLTVASGEEGLGKSVFAAWMLARATRGDLPGEWLGRPASVLVVAGEDGIADMWRPRLELARADLDLVGFLNLDKLGPEWNLRDGIESLAAAVEEITAGIIYIDSALDHMPPPRGRESINSPTYARDALGPLRALVRHQGVAAAFSLHPPKARGTSYREMVQASQAFSAIPRVGWLLAYHPDDDPSDPDRRPVLIRGKGNLGANPGTLSFRVGVRRYRHDGGVTGEREVVVDLEPSPVTLADLAPKLAAHGPSKAETAAEIVRAELTGGGWKPAEAVRAALAAAGVTSSSVIDRASRIARVEKRKRPGVVDGPWEWRLGSSPADPSTPGPGDGFFDSSTAARARTLPGTDCSPSNTPIPSNNGKSPTIPSSPAESEARGRIRHGAAYARGGAREPSTRDSVVSPSPGSTPGNRNGDRPEHDRQQAELVPDHPTDADDDRVVEALAQRFIDEFDATDEEEGRP